MEHKIFAISFITYTLIGIIMLEENPYKWFKPIQKVWAKAHFFILMPFALLMILPMTLMGEPFAYFKQWKEIK